MGYIEKIVRSVSIRIFVGGIVIDMKQRRKKRRLQISRIENQNESIAKKRRQRKRKIYWERVLVAGCCMAVLLIGGIGWLVQGDGVQGEANASTYEQNENNAGSESAVEQKPVETEDVLAGLQTTTQTIMTDKEQDQQTTADPEKTEKEAQAAFIADIVSGKQTVSCVRNGSIYQNKDAKKMVALTFDDGPYTNMTEKYLAILEQYDAKATFFVLGQYVLTKPDSAKHIVASGNEIASHTWYHHNMPKLKAADIQEDFRKTEAAFEQVLGFQPNLFRAPYGSINQTVRDVAKSYGQQSVMWSIDPQDWKVKDSEQIAYHILNRVQDGDIILLHENKKATLEALPLLLSGLQKKGYEVVTVSELIYQSSVEVNQK